MSLRVGRQKRWSYNFQTVKNDNPQDNIVINYTSIKNMNTEETITRRFKIPMHLKQKNTKNIISWHTIIIVETSDRENKCYKWSQNKRHTMHCGKQVRVATSFSFDENTNQKKKKKPQNWTASLKCSKNETVNLEFYIQQNNLQKWSQENKMVED